MDKYVIIDREFIEGRIKELEEQRRKLQIDDIDGFNSISSMISGLKFSLSRSTPLIPEIVKSFESGQDYQGRFDKNLSIEGKTIGEYISTLKV
jgi:hypothetical protein